MIKLRFSGKKKAMDYWLLRFQVKSPISWSPRPPSEPMPANHVREGTAQERAVWGDERRHTDTPLIQETQTHICTLDPHIDYASEYLLTRWQPDQRLTPPRCGGRSTSVLTVWDGTECGLMVGLPTEVTFVCFCRWSTHSWRSCWLLQDTKIRSIMLPGSEKNRLKRENR